MLNHVTDLFRLIILLWLEAIFPESGVYYFFNWKCPGLILEILFCRALAFPYANYHIPYLCVAPVCKWRNFYIGEIVTCASSLQQGSPLWYHREQESPCSHRASVSISTPTCTPESLNHHEYGFRIFSCALPSSLIVLSKLPGRSLGNRNSFLLSLFHPAYISKTVNTFWNSPWNQQQRSFASKKIALLLL